MVDYAEEIYDQAKSYREPIQNIFKLVNNCLSESFPEELSQSKNKDNPKTKIGEGSEIKNIDHHQNLIGNSKNLYDIGEKIKSMSSKEIKKEVEKILKPINPELDKSKENEKEASKQEKKEKEKNKIKKNKKIKENKKDISNIEQEKREKTFKSKYISEDGQNYIICLEETKNEIIISLSNEKDSHSLFTSKYELDYLNEKFGKNIDFESIQEFRTCLKDNVQKQILVIKKPNKNVINTVWELYPNNAKDKKTFTLISSQSLEKNLSLFFYSNFKRAEKVVKEIEDKAKMKPSQENKENSFEEKKYNKLIDKMIFLDDKLEKSDTKLESFKDRINLNIEENEKKNIKFRNVLIFFDEKNLLDIINELIKKFYDEQIFIIIFSSDNDLKRNIYNKIQNLSESKRSYFDLNNIFIFKNESNEYKKIMIPILKIFRYFNQLGDGFFKQLSDLGIKNENLEKEFKYLYNTHYFNILLCGRKGSGKSAFINAIMGEKKSLTSDNIYDGTYRNNYYIHKNYPIKLIDVCGFTGGSEIDENLNRLKLIYNENCDNIIIDEYANDCFSFYEDKRNNIHLLLYFISYKDKYDMSPKEMPIIMEAIKMNIPIIFIVNKCENNIFEDKLLLEDIMEEVKKARDKTIYKKYETYFINCITKKGFDTLLSGIYKRYEKYIISKDNLSKIKSYSINVKEFISIYRNYIFLEVANIIDIFLNKSFIDSLVDIKNILFKLSRYYLKELGIFRTFNFYLYNKFYNNLLKSPEKNFFPMLTDLLKKIFLNFGFKKTTKECNNFILLKLSKYFKIKLDFLENKKKEKNKTNEKEEKDDDKEERNKIEEASMDKNNDEEKEEFDFNHFKDDYVNLGKLYWFSKNNFLIKLDVFDFISKNKDIKLLDKLFNLEEENNDFKPERLYQIVKKDFGLDNSKNDPTNKEKLIIKIFYILYVSNILLCLLCAKINLEEFTFCSTSNFFYTISKSYNNAINGFLKIKEQMENKDSELSPD